MSLRIWIIVGESETGKSTLVGHLMGQFGKSDTGLKHNGANFCNVPQIGGGSMQFFSARCALQESPKGDGSPKDARRHLIEKWKNKPAHQSMNCLITLRLNQDEGHGTAYKYIDEFLKAGDEFIAGVGLAVDHSDQDKLMSYGAPFLFLPDRTKVKRTILEGAAAVRQQFSLGLINPLFLRQESPTNLAGLSLFVKRSQSSTNNACRGSRSRLED